MSKLRVLALMHRHLIPPDTIPEGTDLVSAPWRTDAGDWVRSMELLVELVQPEPGPDPSPVTVPG